jgi:hypothetical protein
MKSPKSPPQRVRLHAYEQLNRVRAEIQCGRCPTKADLGRIVERQPRTIRRILEALVDSFDVPLKFDHNFYFTDPTWR